MNSRLLHPPRVLQSSPQGVVFSSLAQSPSSLFFPFPSSRLCAAPFDSSHLCLLTCLLVDSGWAPLASLCLPSPSSQYSLQLCLFQLQSVFMLCIQQDPQHRSFSAFPSCYPQLSCCFLAGLSLNLPLILPTCPGSLGVTALESTTVSNLTQFFLL